MENIEKMEKLKKLNEKEAATLRELKQAQQRLKILQNRRKIYDRKERTHRLCQHGALLEHFFPPDEFTDEMIMFLLNGLFDRSNDEVRKQLEEVKDIFSTKIEFEDSDD